MEHGIVSAGLSCVEVRGVVEVTWGRMGRDSGGVSVCLSPIDAHWLQRGQTVKTAAVPELSRDRFVEAMEDARMPYSYSQTYRTIT